MRRWAHEARDSRLILRSRPEAPAVPVILVLVCATTQPARSHAASGHASSRDRPQSATFYPITVGTVVATMGA